MKLQIEAGKFYRTRDGRKARVYATDAGGKYPMHGAIQCNGGWEQHGWTDGGRYVTTLDCCSSDIVAEWTEAPAVNWSAMPAWAQWVAMDANSQWFWYLEKPESCDVYVEWLSPAGACGQIPAPHIPTFTGDWKQSLVKRP